MATRGSNVLCRSSRNDPDLGYDCYGRTDNLFVSILINMNTNRLRQTLKTNAIITLKHSFA